MRDPLSGVPFSLCGSDGLALVGLLASSGVHFVCLLQNDFTNMHLY